MIFHMFVILLTLSITVVAFLGGFSAVLILSDPTNLGVNTDPRNGEELGAPFFQASVAAAMDYDVEVICTATSGSLMKKGVAEKLFVKQGSPKSVYDFIKDAHEAGVKFYCCSPNLDLFDMSKDDLIPECSGIVGGAYMIEEVMESDCKVLTY